ncbi:MAG: GAF domain-containing protein [Chloroflexi bacterium]|nr:GAF domain-containing protein [Ktedonobacteraceae bacterium]MBV9707779.1 GAF domain-containing protein [Chloroflexota bacterium]
MSIPSWTSVLQDIIGSHNERQKIATALDITTTTLSRWANSESKPQRPDLIRLLQVVPSQYRQEFLEALEEEYPDAHTWLLDDTDATGSIDSDFFAQVLNVRTTTTESLLFWRISDMVLRKALDELDPNQLGMSIKLIQCMPPSHDGKIRSLREIAGKGTAPWTADLEHEVIFLGLESMSGYTVEVRHVINHDDLYKNTTFPAYRGEYEFSAAAYPICLEGRIAGCLLAASRQPGHFSQQRLALLATFSNLIALALNKDEFYSPELVDMRVMPPPEKQQPIVATFRERVWEKFRTLAQGQERPSNQAVELLVWQEIESELLKLPIDSSSSYSV